MARQFDRVCEVLTTLGYLEGDKVTDQGKHLMRLYGDTDLLARALQQAAARVRHCDRCNTFTEGQVCNVCLDPRRDATKLCVVETPADQAALERTGAFRGYYFVLMGRLSPLDGVGTHELGVQSLMARARDGQVQEVILALSFTAEGEVTAHVLQQALGCLAGVRGRGRAIFLNEVEGRVDTFDGSAGHGGEGRLTVVVEGLQHTGGRLQRGERILADLG